MAASAAQTGQGLAQNLVQRPADQDSEDEESPDESQMTPFEREIAQRKRDFERSQHLQRAKQAKRSGRQRKAQSNSTMDGTGEYEEENVDEADLAEDQLDKNILDFVADSSDENE